MNQPVYFDYCATTPIHPLVLKAMLPVLESDFGNPSSMHWSGQKASEIKENSRKMVSHGLGCQPEEIIFTSGATEADNLAIFGVLRKFSPGDAHMITCLTEHHAVIHAAEQAEKEGYAVTFLPVDQYGLVDLDVLEKSIRKETRLISIMLVNNETGTIQPVKEINKIARRNNIIMHTDAVQGMLLSECQVDTLGVDLLSISAHKIYGPKGIGALYLRGGIQINPILFGGPQEKHLRAGTENMPGIAGLGAAVQHIQQSKDQTRRKLAGLRKRLFEGLQSQIPEVIINGRENQTAPHILSVSFPRSSGEMILFHLNMHGIAVSLGSACTSKDIVPSHVLKAMNLSLEYIEGSVRISLGEPTSETEIDRLIDVLPDIVQDATPS